jgi:hypothetical protein
LDELDPDFSGGSLEDMWAAEDDIMVGDIHASDWQAPADQEIVELPATNRVLGMNSTPEQIEQFAQTHFGQPGQDFQAPGWYSPSFGFPNPDVGIRPATLTLKDDDLIEALAGSGGDFDVAYTLRDVARRQTNTPPRTPMSARSGSRERGRGPPGPPDMWEADPDPVIGSPGGDGRPGSPVGSIPPHLALDAPMPRPDAFSVGSISDLIEQPHSSQDIFEGARMPAAAFGGQHMGLSNQVTDYPVLDDPFPQVQIMDDDNYIVLEL